MFVYLSICLSIDLSICLSTGVHAAACLAAFARQRSFTTFCLILFWAIQQLAVIMQRIEKQADWVSAFSRPTHGSHGTKTHQRSGLPKSSNVVVLVINPNKSPSQKIYQTQSGTTLEGLGTPPNPHLKHVFLESVRDIPRFQH